MGGASATWLPVVSVANAGEGHHHGQPGVDECDYNERLYLIPTWYVQKTFTRLHLIPEDEGGPLGGSRHPHATSNGPAGHVYDLSLALDNCPELDSVAELKTS